ncbi:MAG: indolepyruvate oxidoreductase subunit beta [Lachnospiraceae bacterium]|nr:indolepyruvate oxidoreductase subunit beta [Lachnospiraceae bacterium]MBR6356661.1 indolepyruvate oxidoreductase subunit beta [Lachnospiraceae bacterium]
MTKRILMAGVGGQGTILTSKVLSEGLIQEGYDVKMCEIHGMAQRGGSVTTQIVFGEEVYSTCINTGEADVLIAFEKAEAARFLPNLKEGGKLIVNDLEIYSLPVLTGAVKYPEHLEDLITAAVPDVIILNANKIAADLGNSKAQNIVLLGVLVKALGLEEIDWEAIICRFVPEKLQDLNKKAFQAGLTA